MSDRETDAYWDLQLEYLQDFMAYADANGKKKGRTRIDEMKLNPEIDTSTISACEDYLVFDGDAVDEWRDDKPNRDRDEDDRREKYFLGDV